MEPLTECRWWAHGVLASVRHAPGPVCVAVAVIWLSLPWSIGALGVLLVITVAGRCWALKRPVSFSRVTGPFRGCWWRWRLRRSWSDLVVHCRLVTTEAPAIRRTRVRWPHVHVVVRPAPGQTGRDFEEAVEALRLAVGASRLRVESEGVRDLLLTFTIGDELRIPFVAQPAADEDGLRAVAIGRTERGEEWRLPVGPHTLVAGCSGSGKGSIFWSFAFGLAPAVHSGRVQLHGIDLKGGMEVLMGRDLFTTTATDAFEAVVSLERLVDEMRLRNQRYAGHVRTHAPTSEQPLHVVMIDELAALTAYCAERELQRRAESAINLLCSQGRAPGFVVFACLQDPRKEVIPSRGLFTQMVGLRLKDLSETSMVLGETAVATGAHCHKITRDVPGTAYVVPEDGGPPLRVRAGYASDDSIRDVARRYATPTKIHLDVPPADDPSWQSARRRSSREVAR